jgi:hypothetical protein
VDSVWNRFLNAGRKPLLQCLRKYQFSSIRTPLSAGVDTITYLRNNASLGTSGVADLSGLLVGAGVVYGVGELMLDTLGDLLLDTLRDRGVGRVAYALAFGVLLSRHSENSSELTILNADILLSESFGDLEIHKVMNDIKEEETLSWITRVYIFSSINESW